MCAKDKSKGRLSLNRCPTPTIQFHLDRRSSIAHQHPRHIAPIAMLVDDLVFGPRGYECKVTCFELETARALWCGLLSFEVCSQCFDCVDGGADKEDAVARCSVYHGV